MSRFSSSPRWMLIAAVVLVLGGAVLLRLTQTNLAAAQTPVLTAFMIDVDPGLDPAAAIWEAAPNLDVTLTAQQVTYPVGGSVPMLNARALHFQDRLYLRLAWDDPSLNDRSFAAEDFADAVAVEFPADAASSVPSVCMGQADAGVNIWYWRADSQTGVVDDPALVRPGAAVDDYPLEGDPLDYPARAVGNPVAVAGGPVQNLVAQAFGTLAPAVDQSVEGSGEHDGEAWAVVISRPFAAASVDETSFARGVTTDIAFAVWDGEQEERNGQKSISQFVRLTLSEDSADVPLPPQDVTPEIGEPDGDGDGVSWPAAVAIAISVPLIILIMLGLFNQYSDERRR